MQFDVLCFDTAGNIAPTPNGVTFRVERWSHAARGGPALLELFADGEEIALGRLQGWLGYRVLVLDSTVQACWWGTIESAALPAGKRVFTYSLNAMANRIAVAYTYQNERFDTAWAEDSESVFLYGKRERLVMLPVGRADQATALRDTELNNNKAPARDMQREGGNGAARFLCVGYWQRMGKVYYGSSEGYERHLTADSAEKIGQSGYTLAGIRFEGNKIIVGSAQHYVETNKIQKLGQGAYTASTIGFEDSSEDRAWDTANGFTAFSAGDRVTITGSALNNATKDVSKATASHLTFTTDVDDESPGASITITPTSYTRLSQSFVTAGGLLETIKVRCRRQGTVADDLSCTIYADVSGAPGGAALQMVNVTGSTVNTEAGDVLFTFPGTLNMTAGVTYWKVYTRTGGNSASGAYVFEVDEASGYAGGVMKVYNGSSWIARPTPADMLFEVAYAPSDNLQAFVGGDVITVSGSASNNGTYTVQQVETESFPHYLQVSVALVKEAAGATVTIATRYTKLAQRFRITDAAGWVLNAATIRAQKVGAILPSDGLTLQIHADSAGAIGSSLATATIAAADIVATSIGEVSADFGTTLHLTAGAYYWLSVKRTGADTSQDGYLVLVDDDAGYANGKLQGWDGSTWGDRSPASDMYFELAGVRETTQLLADILTATGLFAGVDLRVNSGVYASPYYDGDGLALGIVERLLQGGTSAGGMLVATVTQERWVRIEAAPTVGSAYSEKGDGSFIDPFNRDIPLHLLPAGVWLRQDDLPGTLDVAALASATAMFIEEMEYNNTLQGAVRPRFQQIRNPLNVGMREG